MSNNKILYIDMDNVMVDFQSGIDQLAPTHIKRFEGRLDECPHIFCLMEPMEGAVEAVEKLAEVYDVYALSTSPWQNPRAACDKYRWIQQYLPEVLHKRLILSHNKHLNIGDYLIDDRLANGADRFTGEHIHFGTDKFPDWDAVLEYLL